MALAPYMNGPPLFLLQVSAGAAALLVPWPFTEQPWCRFAAARSATLISVISAATATAL
jgi:hypothetical protein